MALIKENLINRVFVNVENDIKVWQKIYSLLKIFQLDMALILQTNYGIF